MSVTHDAINDLILNNKVTSPCIVQVQNVVPIDNGERLLVSQRKQLEHHIKAKVSDCDYSISTIIICDTIEEADTIKQFSLIEVTNGFVLVSNNSSDDLFFVIEKFKIISNQVTNQLCPNIKELRTKNQFNLYYKIDLSKREIIPLNMLTESTIGYVVKGVVVQKSGRIQYEKGYLFHFIIQDIDGNEMKCICFNDICDKYIDIIQVDNTYYISRYYLQPPKKSYFRTEKMIDLDCIVNSETIIQKSHDSIQRRKSDTKPIKDLENCPINSLHSICGVITSISETKPRGDKIIRVIEVVDESEMVIEINFWGNLTQILDEFEVGQNVQFDNLQLCSFNYKHMTYTGCSSFNELPCSDETRLLTQKIEENNYELPNTQRYSDSIPSSFPIMSLKEFEENARNANGDHFKAIVTGYITAFRTDAISYIGCNNCKKKVDIDVIVCSNCKKQKCTPQHQYNLKVEIQDSTNKIWGTMFDEVATKFMGISAEKLADLKESNFDNYIISFRSKSFTKVELGLQGKLNGKGGVSTTIFHCQILDEDETN